MYNSEKTIEKCLESIFNSTYKDFEVIAINDGSADSTLEKIKKYNCKIINLDKNKGVANARNIGIKYSKADILVFMDSDVLVHKDTIAKLVETYKSDPNVRIVGAIDSGKCFLSDSLWKKFVTLKHCYDYKWEENEKIRKLSCLQTSCCLMEKKIFDKIGYFDTSYKGAGGEEYEIAHRLLEKGYITYVCRSIFFDHYKENMKKRAQILLKRAIVHLPLLLKRKNFESDGTTGTRFDAFMSFFSFLGLITIPLMIVSTKLLIISLLSFMIVLIANLKFFSHLAKKQGFFFSLLSPFFLIFTYLTMSLGIILGVIKLFLNRCGVIL